MRCPELTNYYDGTGMRTDKRAALIFKHFARHKMREPERIAKENDEEYEEDSRTGLDFSVGCCTIRREPRRAELI